MIDINTFLQAIQRRECVVGVVGMGYVGLPLALEFAEKGFPVLGFDIDDEKVNALNAGQSYIKHIPATRIEAAVECGTLKATSDYRDISKTNAALIAVPTPLSAHHEPDMSFIVFKSASFISLSALAPPPPPPLTYYDGLMAPA